MKLSIVVLTYNQEKFVRTTLESIVTQNTNYSYEVIIGDDASSDNTPKIILEYAHKYPQIIRPVLRNENIGLIRNYFSLISMCTGEYIMECAGDDYWEKNKIDHQLKYMERHEDVSMVCGAVRIVDESGRYLKTTFFKNVNFEFRRLLKFNSVSALSVCFKKEVIDTYIAQINPLNKSWKMEDYPFWLWISKNGKIEYLPEPVGYYRVVNNSASNAMDINKQIEFEKSVYSVRKYFATDNRQRKKAISTYYVDVACIYMAHGDWKNYLRYALKFHKIINILKSPFRIIRYYTCKYAAK
ncbi:MAG TPA: hypothetical protein DDY31_19345 [Lachnospiraceae bacterium]|nr:hypothetical protein [Lachnospiraceae bacterium]